jgi:hypothetical protein
MTIQKICKQLYFYLLLDEEKLCKEHARRGSCNGTFFEVTTFLKAINLFIVQYCLVILGNKLVPVNTEIGNIVFGFSLGAKKPQ